MTHFCLTVRDHNIPIALTLMLQNIALSFASCTPQPFEVRDKNRNLFRVQIKISIW